MARSIPVLTARPTVQTSAEGREVASGSDWSRHGRQSTIQEKSEPPSTLIWAPVMNEFWRDAQ